MSNPANVNVLGLGTAVPAQWITQEDSALYAAELCMAYDRSRTLPALYRRAGVRKRHSVVLEEVPPGSRPKQSFYGKAEGNGDRGPTTETRMQFYERAAPALAHDACQRALERARVAPEAITHLVTVSCSGFASPGFDLSLYPLLGLRPSVSRTHVGFMGCHGMMNGIRVGSAYATSHPDARVLICAVELCSLHHQYTDDAQQLVANALFSDGAAAIVLGPDGSRDPSHEAAPAGAWQVVSQGSTVIPETTEMMSWRIADHGFQMTLSPRVPDIILQTLRPWMSEWLAGLGESIESIGGWAVHPGGPRILKACSEALGLAEDELRESESVLADFGNMSSPTVVFILERLMQRESVGTCVTLAFGPGLTVEAALLRKQ